MQKFVFILLNLLAFPGIGTFLSGKRIKGMTQLGLAGAGFSLSIWGAGVLIQKILFSGLPLMEMSQALADETLISHSEFAWRFAFTLTGLGIFSLAWIWAAFTPQGRPTPPPLPPS